jgi:hypothetical protein
MTFIEKKKYRKMGFGPWGWFPRGQKEKREKIGK